MTFFEGIMQTLNMAYMKIFWSGRSNQCLHTGTAAVSFCRILGIRGSIGGKEIISSVFISIDLKHLVDRRRSIGRMISGPPQTVMCLVLYSFQEFPHYLSKWRPNNPIRFRVNGAIDSRKIGWSVADRHSIQI